MSSSIYSTSIHNKFCFCAGCLKSEPSVKLYRISPAGASISIWCCTICSILSITREPTGLVGYLYCPFIIIIINSHIHADSKCSTNSRPLVIYRNVVPVAVGKIHCLEYNAISRIVKNTTDNFSSTVIFPYGSIYSMDCSKTPISLNSNLSN